MNAAANSPKPAASPPAFLAECVTFPELARHYGVSLTQVYKWVEEGLPNMKFGRRRLVRLSVADRWIEARFDDLPPTSAPASAPAAHED